MNIEHLSHWSGQLNREMYVNRYGHAGIPVVVFASSGGSHNEYYDFGTQWRRKAKHLHKSVICWAIHPATYAAGSHDKRK